MTFKYNGITFETDSPWIENSKIILYADGTPYKRVVRYNRTDGLYIVFKNTNLFYSDFN